MKNSFLKIFLTFHLIFVIPSAQLFSRGKAYEDPQLSKCLVAAQEGVATAHIEASRVGETILQQGGNAVDAATAIAMALAVVYPQAGNLGGGGFLVYRSGEGQLYTLDFRETAPAAAHPKLYLDQTGKIQAEKSRIGGLAVGVPGTVRGFYQFQQKFGKLPWSTVLQPAIDLAENGFVLNDFMVRAIQENADDLKKFSYTASIFFPEGYAPKAGQRFYQHDLARSLRAIALHGDRAFYEGQIAREIVKTVQQSGGILTLDDLKTYRAIERSPLIFSYNDFQIITLPPPSSGGVILAGIFNALKMRKKPLPPSNSLEQIILLAELERHFFALRNQFLGDPQFVKMPLEQFLSPEFARKIFRSINFHHPVASREISFDQFLPQESEETTHFSVVDSEQNAVSVTYTLNESFGSKLAAISTGILLNNEMDDFTIKPGVPNAYGLLQGEANQVEGGKRMLSSMTPVIVTQNEQLTGVLGTPGGPTIITTMLQVLLNLMEYRMDLPEALAAGRFHHQWMPDSLYLEKNKFDGETLQSLEQRGYPVVLRNHLGDVQAIWRNGQGWQICSDPRGNGYPRGQ
ncbi:MAG: gamma-glutamyltransferase [Calditrichia bacterium]